MGATWSQLTITVFLVLSSIGTEQNRQSDTTDRKLFIGGLNHDTVEATLSGYFQQWGEVIDCVIMKDSMGRSRGFGFITYKESYQLHNAQRNKPHVIDGKEVDPKIAVPKNFEQLDIDTNREQFRKLFIGGLNYETTVDGLRNYFTQFGEIIDCNVMKDGEGRSRGFGFVTFSDLSQLNEAQKKRPHLVDGREVETKRAMPKDMNSGDNNMTVKKMFVGGLKEDTTEEMVRQVFSEYGNIDDVDILKDKGNGRPRGFCFVVFSDYDSVDRAVLKKRHNLNGCNVEVRKAVGKDQMASRGPGPASQRFGGAQDRWMDGPQRNFSRGGRFDRGRGDGYNNGGRGGYNNFGGRGGGGRDDDNFGGPYGGGRGGFNNFGNGGGNFGNSGGGGGNFGNSGGGGGNFGTFGGGGGNFGNFGVGGGNFGNSGGGGGNFGNSGGGGGNFGNSGGGGGNFGNSEGGNFGNSGGGGGNFGNSEGGNFGNSGGGGGNFGNTEGGNFGNSGRGGGNFGNSGGGGYGNSGGGGYGNFSGDVGAYGGASGGGYSNSNNFSNPSGGNGGFNNFAGPSGSGSGGGYQQQNWSGSGGYSDNSNNWGGNDGSTGFGNNYNSGYSGGPVKASSGNSARGRTQGPYGAGYGSSGGSSGSTNNRGGGGGWQ